MKSRVFAHTCCSTQFDRQGGTMTLNLTSEEECWCLPATNMGSCHWMSWLFHAKIEDKIDRNKVFFCLSFPFLSKADGINKEIEDRMEKTTWSLLKRFALMCFLCLCGLPVFDRKSLSMFFGKSTFRSNYNQHHRRWKVVFDLSPISASCKNIHKHDEWGQWTFNSSGVPDVIGSEKILKVLYLLGVKK